MVLNAGSGSGDGADEAVRVAGDRLGSIRILELEPGVDLAEAIGGAVAEGRAVVAAGGDGTVNAVAQHLVGGGTLGVLPLGTRNHFARDLGLLDMDTAVEALAAGQVRRIDAGRAGDRVFVNNCGMGLYPEMVYERGRSERARWLASGAAALEVLRGSDPIAGRIDADGDARALFAWMLFIGNNRFSTTPGSIGQRERLDEGVLDVALLVAGPHGARRSSVAWRVLRSRPWQTSRRLLRREARRVEVRLEGPPRLVSWDGEAGDPTSALEVESLPGALEVLAPRAD